MDTRIGVVGLGRRSRLFDLVHRPAEGIGVTSVCEPDRSRWEEARARFGSTVRLSPELDDVLGDGLDGIGIFSPDWQHAEAAVRALHARVPAFVEKPLAISTEDCDRILRAAQSTSTPLFVGHNMRYMPVIRHMKDLIEAGEIGEVKAVWCRHFVGHGADFYFKDWHARRDNVNGLLLQKGVHDIDVIHWLASASTARCQAFGAMTVYRPQPGAAGEEEVGTLPRGPLDLTTWPPGAHRGLVPSADVEDLSQVNMVLRNGVHAAYLQCMYTPDYWRNYTVIGTEGRLENFGDAEDAVVAVWNSRSDYRPDGDRRYAVADRYQGQGGHGGADPEIVRAFLDLVRDPSTRPPVPPLAARDAVAAACAATESLRDGGRPVTVSPAAEDLAAAFGAMGTPSGPTSVG